MSEIAAIMERFDALTAEQQASVVAALKAETKED